MLHLVRSTKWPRKVIGTRIYIESLYIHTRGELCYSLGNFYLYCHSVLCLTSCSKGIFASPSQLTNTVVVVFRTLSYFPFLYAFAYVYTHVFMYTHSSLHQGATG